MSKSFQLTLFFLCCVASILANDEVALPSTSMPTTVDLTFCDEQVRHHLVVAIDKAGCDDWIGNDEVAAKLLGLLSRQVPQSGGGHRNLYEDGDVVSMLGFAMDARSNDMNTFAIPVWATDSLFAYRNYSRVQLRNLISSSWGDVALQPLPEGAVKFSLVSVAKPYALMSLRNDEQQVNRTFLVLITDHHYNGNDFYDEIRSLIWKQQTMGVSHPLTMERIFKKCYDVEQHYFIRYIDTKQIWGGNGFSPKGYLEFYEYVPLQQHFSLSAAVGYPTHLCAVRERGDTYRVELPLSWRQNPLYRLRRLDAFLAESDTLAYHSPADALQLTTLSDTVVQLHVPAGNGASHVALRAWLSLNDGVYNATIMSPSSASPRELGRDGLNVFIPIEREPQATVFGVPLASWAWLPFFDTQQAAASFWKWVFWLLIALALLWLFYRVARPETYTPKASEFSIGSRE